MRTHRILVADDLPSIHDDFRKVLDPPGRSTRLAELEAAAFGGEAPEPEAAPAARFELSFATQGEEAVSLARQAAMEARPFSLCFLDVRMPPGIDGVETAERLRRAAPDLQIVLCTAYADHSSSELVRRFGDWDGLLILKKPFEPVEVMQLAHALTMKWHLARENAAARAELERRVRERTAELVTAHARLLAASEAAGAAERAKSEFLSRMSHDLRTPLNGVLGMTEVLLDSPHPPEMAESLVTIRDSGRTLLELVDRILMYAGLDRAPPPRASGESFHPEPILAAVAARLRPAARAKGLFFDYDVSVPPSLRLSGDAASLHEVVRVILDNAVKFTDHGGVRLRAIGHAAGIIVEVTDTGPGVPEALRERIFQPFSPADGSISRRHPGTGLSLALSRRLVELVSGSLVVGAAPGAGAVFTLEWPAAPQPEPVTGGVRGP